MIRIGNQTACWAASPIEPFEYALAQNFDAFEWFPDKKPGAGWDDSDLNGNARKAISDNARARGVRLSVHARWQANPLAPDGYSLLDKDLALARDLGAALLNIHLFHEQGMAVFLEAIRALVRKTTEAGLLLAIENTPHHSPEQFNDLFARLHDAKGVETGHVGMCLDMGHANLCAATRNDYLRFLDRLEPQVPIIHLHLHENWGDADSHLPLFTGPASKDDSGIRGLLDRLKRRKFSGSAILEQWPHPPLLLNNARDRLLQLWKPGNDELTKSDESAPTTPEIVAIPTTPGTDFVTELAAGDRRSKSWREKLNFAYGLLARDNPAITSDQLLDLAIYLRFLGTGEIACAEDGRHFRPAHHARIAAQIRERLARLTTPETELVVRKIYPWLPSSAPSFQRPEPLTRIRDIAHRNDIDPDLKREIKTTLQNKLHRCAGPEDLATSSALLERITAPGTNHSPAFVEQFRIFHEELREFFNARSLEERLEALQPLVEIGLGNLIRLFVQQKSDGTLKGRLAGLKTLTSLRQAFLKLSIQGSGPDAQEFLLADVALEDFAFVLLSEITNDCEILGSDPAVGFKTEALQFALTNLALSGPDQTESGAIESELQAWGKLSADATRDEVLRLKATLLRCRRLAEDFGDRVIALYTGRVERLGLALGVSDQAIGVFAESDIRGHLVFQVSKLVTSLLRWIRLRFGLPAWDVIVGGKAAGRAVRLDSLDQRERDSQESAVVLLKGAEGDEEIPGNVSGIALAHELPHLSHLAVRARQAGIVLVAFEEPSEFEKLTGFEGQRISLLALPDSVSWETAPEVETAFDRKAHTAPRIPPARLSQEGSWIPLEEVADDTGGAKAAGARRLAQLAGQQGAGFETPPALAVPFGVMERALRAKPSLERDYSNQLKRLEKMDSQELLSATKRLRRMILQLEVPAVVTLGVQRQFAGKTSLIVRSSANCEDLEGFAGAGLYESVINVPLARVAEAIRTVWASLWTERAVLSRLKSGIRHELAYMGVLIQELIDPDFSFILHTSNPITHDSEEVYAEIVVGLGETLASASTRGGPYRLAINKACKGSVTLAFANFSHASRPAPGGGMRHETLDYSRVDLSRDTATREALGRRLGAVGCFVEKALGKPQDIEGAVLRDRLYLVQSRPQQGVQNQTKV